MNAQERTALDLRQKSLVAISALTAAGDLQALGPELGRALDAGLTVNEIKEAVTQLYAYCGFPRSLNATSVFMDVMGERKARGISDKEGKPIPTENHVRDKYEQGRKTLETLTKTPQPKPAKGFGEFMPRSDMFLKEHLFADIFSNDVLSFPQREFVTIAALSSMEGVAPQLAAHVGMGKNVGITDAQLSQVADIVEGLVGRAQANTLRKIIGVPETALLDSDMIVRIAEIEVLPEYLAEYLGFSKEVAAATVANEPGVISIFPMQVNENKNLVRIVEIYRNKQVYEAHIKSAHFRKYKEGTLKMVKSLKLVDSKAFDPEDMQRIFKRLR